MPMTMLPMIWLCAVFSLSTRPAIDRRDDPRDTDEAEVLIDADLDELRRVRARRRHARALGSRAGFPERGQLGQLVAREHVDIGLRSSFGWIGAPDTVTSSGPRPRSGEHASSATSIMRFRRRRARREFGGDPDEGRVRPPEVVGNHER